MCPGDVWGWRGLWWGFTWRYSIINQCLTMGMGPRLRSYHLPANPLEPPFPPQCSPLPSSRPTWSHAEASDDADHAGHADVAHPGQGGLRGDTGLGTLLGAGPELHTQHPWDMASCLPRAWRWLLGPHRMYW